jgi:signal transduction histidine kinase/ActR/RegA family two-component response regulator
MIRMEKTIPQLEKELNIFYHAIIDQACETESDVQRLMDAYRDYFGLDLVYVLENDNANGGYIYTQTSVSDPQYDLNGITVPISVSDHNWFLKMYDEDGLCAFVRPNASHIDIKAALSYAVIFEGEICGCVGMMDCHDQRQWSDDERMYTLKLGRMLSNHIIKKRLSRKNADYSNMAQKAKAANEAKSRFLFNMSHDIRTPMNAVIGYTRLAKKCITEPEKAVDYLDKITSAGEELLALINQVLEMSRIESGKLVLARTHANVLKEAGAMVDIMAINAEGGGVKLEMVIKNLEHENVLTDPESVTQVMVNVLSNAVKYSRSGSLVRFIVDEQPHERPGYGNYVFTVEDHGIGMSPDFIDHIFDEFSRENNTTANKIQGTGLGMSIVKRLVDLLGGTIHIDSTLGKGTTVTIALPMEIETEVHEEAVKLNAEEVNKLKGKRVLLVEDNAMNIEIAEELLKERDIIVETATDGDIAVQMVKDTVNRGDCMYYDFILMDIQMPRMNGHEATKAIRAIPAPPNWHIPIIAMTSNAFEEDRQAALAAGMDEHIAKPIDINKLIHAMSRFCR